MEKHVGDVVPPALQPEELAIQHVRQPGEREPVGGVARRERPLNALERDALAHVGIAGNGIGVVEIDEIEMPDLAIHGESDQDQSETDPARLKTRTVYLR